MKLDFSRQTFEEVSNIKFHQNLSGGSYSMRTDRPTDMMKLIVAPKNTWLGLVSGQEHQNVSTIRTCLRAVPRWCSKELKGKKEHYRRCKCNVILRRVYEPLLPWKSNKRYIFLCVRVGACVRAGVCVIGCVGERMRAYICARVCLLIQYATLRRHIVCVLLLHHIFRHYFINGTIFEKRRHWT